MQVLGKVLFAGGMVEVRVIKCERQVAVRAGGPVAALEAAVLLAADGKAHRETGHHIVVGAGGRISLELTAVFDFSDIVPDESRGDLRAPIRREAVLKPQGGARARARTVEAVHQRG